MDLVILNMVPLGFQIRKNVSVLSLLLADLALLSTMWQYFDSDIPIRIDTDSVIEST